MPKPDCTCWLPDGKLERCPKHGPIMAAARKTLLRPEVSSTDGMDALAVELDRRAALADKNAACPDSAKLLREVASACRVVLEAAREAQSERASIGADELPAPARRN